VADAVFHGPEDGERHNAGPGSTIVIKATGAGIADAQHVVQAGSFVCVPPAVRRTFSNPGPAPVRFLSFNTPAGWEEYMRELGAAAESRPLTSDVIGPIASRHDFQAV
jgi:hypothetical protein